MMNSPPPRRDEAPGAIGGLGEAAKQVEQHPEFATVVPIAQRPFVVVIHGTRRREWGRYLTFAKADDQARALQKHGFDAHVETAELPEHGGARRAFLIWACMLGAVPPERVVDRIVAEIAAESEVQI